MLDIFLPIKVGNYYLIAQKIVAISINGYFITITLVKISGNKRTILASKEQQVVQDEAIAYELQIGTALEKLLQGLSFDIVKIIIPSSLAIFKTLKLPFTDLEKLKMVLPFEIEQLLPFSLQEGSIDCIQTKIFTATKESQVIVSVIRQETITLYREICKHAGIDLTILSLDVFEIASLYAIRQDPTPETSAIINFDKECITVMLFEKTTLSGIRVIIQSYNDEAIIEEKAAEEYAKKHDIATESSLPTEAQNEAPDEAVKAVTIKKSKKKIIAPQSKTYSEHVIENIAETLDILKQQTGINHPIDQLWVTGTIESSLPELAASMEKFIEKPTSIFPCVPLQEIILEKSTIEDRACSPSHLASFSGALSLKDMSSFNLAHEENVHSSKKLLTKQVITSFILLLIFLATVCIWDYINLSTILKAEAQLEKDTIQFIKNNFDLAGKNISGIDRAQKDANEIVTKLEDTWLSVSGSKRYHFLIHLNTLSLHINKDIKGLHIEEISFKSGSADKAESMDIKGLTTDFLNLQKLEDGIRSTDLFVSVPQSQDPHFNYHLIFRKHGL